MENNIHKKNLIVVCFCVCSPRFSIFELFLQRSMFHCQIPDDKKSY